MAKRFSWPLFWKAVAWVGATVATPLAILSHGGTVVDRYFRPTPPMSTSQVFAFNYGPFQPLWPSGGMLTRGDAGVFCRESASCGRVDITNPLTHEVTDLQVFFPDDAVLDCDVGEERRLVSVGPDRSFKLGGLAAGKLMTIRYWMKKAIFDGDEFNFTSSVGHMPFKFEAAYTAEEMRRFHDGYYVWLTVSCVALTLLVATWGWNVVPTVYVEDEPTEPPAKVSRAKKGKSPELEAG